MPDESDRSFRSCTVGDRIFFTFEIGFDVMSFIEQRQPMAKLMSKIFATGYETD
ncbi:MAG: hypothetical protein RMY34_30830 [Aulosira sp. DedQUE10]|nr:hypothetical protein [Aulosira sp. DedQUE10]